MLSKRTNNCQTSVIDHENDNILTYEKCPEIAQSMLLDEQLVKNLEPGSEYFLKRVLNIGFQESEIKDFSSLLDNSRLLKKRKGPEYRKINRYFKSKTQYWKERNRRKRAWELSGQGLNYKQIAGKLGVSEKTIQRDIKKIQPYYLRLSRNYFKKLEQERIDNLNAELEGKTLSQRFSILTKKMIAYRYLLKQREYNRHMIKIIIDMDDLTCGFPAIRLWPKLPISLRSRPYYFQFHVQRNGKQYYMGEIKLG
jgi:transposase